jgi:rRNA maturation endonuclease Nob1
VVIIAFIGFSAFNWRCPSCKRYLGADINRHMCKKCGTRLR